MRTEEDIAWAYEMCVKENGKKEADAIMAMLEGSPEWSDRAVQEILTELLR